MEESTSAGTVDSLSFDEETVKRAQWEGFEFRVLAAGEVEVVNESYDSPAEHTYTVSVDGGTPSDCTCPAWEYQEGACKHMVAVAIREPVVEAAARPPMRADGGVTVETTGVSDFDERPDDCDCGDWNAGHGLSCWPCYREGFEMPNPLEEDGDR